MWITPVATSAIWKKHTAASHREENNTSFAIPQETNTDVLHLKLEQFIISCTLQDCQVQQKGKGGTLKRIWKTLDDTEQKFVLQGTHRTGVVCIHSVSVFKTRMMVAVYQYCLEGEVSADKGKNTWFESFQLLQEKLQQIDPYLDGPHLKKPM